MESELVPCLRHCGMALEAAQPLASGLLTSRYHRDMPNTAHEPGRRFDSNHLIGRHMRDRSWHGAYFDGLETIRAAAKVHGLTVIGCALRWLNHHSVLKDLGDAVIIGGSTVEQLEGQLMEMEKGALPEDVAKAMEEAWQKAKKQPWQYHV